MYLIMANLNLGQYVANKRARKYPATSYTLEQAVGMRRYNNSLININPSAPTQHARGTEVKVYKSKQ